MPVVLDGKREPFFTQEEFDALVEEGRSDEADEAPDEAPDEEPQRD